MSKRTDVGNVASVTVLSDFFDRSLMLRKRNYICLVILRSQRLNPNEFLLDF